MMTKRLLAGGTLPQPTATGTTSAPAAVMDLAPIERAEVLLRARQQSMTKLNTYPVQIPELLAKWSSLPTPPSVPVCALQCRSLGMDRSTLISALAGGRPALTQACSSGVQRALR